MQLFWILSYKCGIVASFLLLGYPLQALELGRVADKNIPQLNQIEHSQSAELLVQSPVPTSEVVQITEVQATPTPQGVEVILQTTQGEQLQITNRSSGNSYIADIPGA